ncbi:hypothetical protein Hanom_Chr04g00328521 [Helianthus anomalus]
MKEHEFYMLSKVVEDMLGKSIEQRFEEIAVEELRAKHQVEIDEQMKNKGKGVESSGTVVEKSIVPAFIQKPIPISSVPSIFAEDVSLEDLIVGDDDEDDDEDDEEEEKDDKKEDDDDEKFV